MKKRILSFILAFAMVLSLITALPITASAYTDGYYTYTVTDRKATITDVDTSISGDVIIPDTLGRYSVTSIGDWAFSYCESLTSITIPDSVTSIGDWAFSYCESLTSITIPDSVTSIGERAFSYCTSLTSITIPDGVTSIGNYAFYYCSSLTSITIPDSVTSIGDWAFVDCTSLTSITIPDGVTSIGNYAFYYCFSLTSITIPDSVTSIGERAFSFCRSLTSITVDENNPNYCSFDGDLFDKNKTTLIRYAAGKNNTSYSIPAGVTSIDGYAFSECYSLTSITIPDSVTSIDNYAFSYCSSLTSIAIPDSVISIGEWAFCDCFSLTSITIPDSVTSIGERAFSFCCSLTSITIPDSVISIDNYAFRGCYSLTSITIPDSVTSIGNYVFSGCSSLTSIAIPDGVTSIGDDAFSDCYSLTSITIPNSVTSIGYAAFSGCPGIKTVYYDGTKADWEKINIGTENDNLASANIVYLGEPQPDGYYTYTVTDGQATITDVDTSISGNVTIPEILGGYPVVAIGAYAFENCSAITNVKIPDSVREIENNAFYACRLLTSVEIPGSVTSNKCLFIGCPKLTDINVSEENKCYTSVDGILFNKDKTTIIRYPMGKTESTYAIPESVTTVGQSAFFCSKLTSVDIPENVTSVERSAFYSSASLTEISIPRSVTIIETGAFSFCSQLTSIKISEENPNYTVVDGVLFNKEKTTLMQYPIGVTNPSYTIPDGTKTIDGWAFFNNKDLTSIYIPKSVKNIGIRAFQQCDSLSMVYYNGSPYGWARIQIGEENSALTQNVVFLGEYTKTTISQDNKTFTISPVNLTIGNTVILALYNGDHFVEMQSATYDGNELIFTATKAYTKVKTMIWESLTTLKALCEAEPVK